MYFCDVTVKVNLKKIPQEHFSTHLLLSIKPLCVSWFLVRIFCLLLASLSSSDLPLLQHTGLACNSPKVFFLFFVLTTPSVFKYSQNSGSRFLMFPYKVVSIQVALIHIPNVDSI